MKRITFLFAIFCLLALAPAATFASGCETMSYSDCNGVVTELEQHTASMDFHLLAQWQQGMAEYTYQAGPQRLTVVVKGLSSPDSAVSYISYQNRGQRVNAQITSSMIASGDFTALMPLYQTIGADFLNEARQLSLAVPTSTASLSLLKWLGFASVDCIAEANPEEHPKVLGIFYASCYYGCVLGGGGWGACGDTCYDKYGAN